MDAMTSLKYKTGTNARLLGVFVCVFSATATVDGAAVVLYLDFKWLNTCEELKFPSPFFV